MCSRLVCTLKRHPTARQSAANSINKLRVDIHLGKLRDIIVYVQQFDTYHNLFGEGTGLFGLLFGRTAVHTIPGWMHALFGGLVTILMRTFIPATCHCCGKKPLDYIHNTLIPGTRPVHIHIQNCKRRVLSAYVYTYNKYCQGTSAVSSTNFGSILILTSWVVGTSCNVLCG